jgi:hypothetical protein
MYRHFRGQASLQPIRPHFVTPCNPFPDPSSPAIAQDAQFMHIKE